MEIVNQPYSSALTDWAKNRPEVIVFSGDLTGSTEISRFKSMYPERFYSLGMAEQNMMGFAGGLAREGFTPFVHTFSVFMYRRALDQIHMSIAYPNVRVRMMGFLPGILTPGGVTHQAIDDIGVLRNLPNVTIIETGDATDIETMFPVLEQIDGPVYVRMLRKQVSRLFPKSEPMQFNRVRVVSEGNDITLITAGICTEEAMRVTELLRAKGVSIEHLHVNMHKPFTDPQVARSISKSKYGVITLENHTVINGLASEVAETIALNGLNAKLYRMGLQDTYSHGASQNYLMRAHGLDAMALTHKIESIVGEKFGIREEDLAAVRLNIKASEGQLEAL